MIAIYENNTIAEIPNFIEVNDTIIFKDIIYKITSKTYDVDAQELYCKLQIYENTTYNICQLLTKIYQSEYFETPGLRTNSISSHPKLAVLMIVLASILDSEHMKNMGEMYKSTVISKWANEKIKWEEIFEQPPPIKNKDINKIIILSTQFLRASIIPRKLWPPLMNQGSSTI
jgi:hypothetical protein